MKAQTSKKQAVFYFECDCFAGKTIYGIETEGKTLLDLMDAEKDLKNIILERGETITLNLTRRPAKLDFERVPGHGWAMRARKA
tara:strand:- start:340 stop:591 length:252 start_codon:yes stop_codon:yes gene_type:complete